jgi:presenilin 1
MLIGYMMFSSAMLLGLLGGNIVIITMGQLEIVVDALTFWIAMYNFAVVGVIAVFYQKGTPPWLAQIYLVITSVIMAWQLGQFPEWSTWALVVVLAFYDLCAVLSPCGPLKWLVNLVQQEGRPLPGNKRL